MRFPFLVHIATSYDEYHYAILKADRLYCINPFSVYLYMYSCLEQQVRTHYKTLRQYNNYNP